MWYLLQAIFYGAEVLFLLLWKPILVIIIFCIGIRYVGKSIKELKKEKNESKNKK